MANETKAELIELVEKLALERSRLSDQLIGAKKATDDVRIMLGANVNRLKFVARHYKHERDRIDAYLSGVLDANRPDAEAHTEPRDTDRFVATELSEVQRRDTPRADEPRHNRPVISSPNGCDDYTYRPHQADRIDWETL